MSLPAQTLETAPEATANLRASLRAVRARDFRPPPRLSVSEWADRNRRLSPEASAEPGQWITARAEYQRGILDAFSDSTVDTVVVMSSAQVGKTEIINNVVGYHIDQEPAPMLVIQPTLTIAEAWSKDRLSPMIRDTPCLAGLVKDARSRDSGNTILQKIFPGGHITMAGANSPASLASRPVRIVLDDEVDRYPASAGSEGDPVSLGKKRSTTFWNRKLGLFSTPTVKGASRIEAAYEASDQRRYFVPCPDCGVFQTLRWSQVKWDRGPDGAHLPDTAQYECEGCHSRWGDAKRWAAIRWGEWRATKPFRGTAGFHLNEIYSPWVELEAMVTEFLEARPFPDRYRVWVNTALGEVWEDRTAKVEITGLSARRELYGPKLPHGVAVLVAGVDVQDDRLELEIVGFGRNEESWGIEDRVIRGNPATGEIWRLLDEQLLLPREREDGIKLRPAASCVDSGGHHTAAVYAFCKPRKLRRVWAIKGVGGTGHPIWPKRPSKGNRERVDLYLVGVDAAKDMLAGRLAIEMPEDGIAPPGYCHFPDAYDDEFFRQLMAEHAVTRYQQGQPRRIWVKKAAHLKNEALDRRVYAIAALHGLFAMGLSLEREADRLDALAKRAQSPDRDPPPTPSSPARGRRMLSPGISV